MKEHLRVKEEEKSTIVNQKKKRTQHFYTFLLFIVCNFVFVYFFIQFRFVASGDGQQIVQNPLEKMLDFNGSYVVKTKKKEKKQNTKC